jgi:hypothetical protein
MADETPPPSQHVQPDRPATQHVETREETVARVMGAEEAVSVGRGGTADPSTRRGLQRRARDNFFKAFACGGVAGIVLGLALYFLPGPREEGRGLGLERTGWPNAVGYALIMGMALAVVAAVITTFITLMREDGRVEREVQEKTGHGNEGPGRANRPEEDPPLG